jgi:hypothetical protein
LGKVSKSLIALFCFVPVMLSFAGPESKHEASSTLGFPVISYLAHMQQTYTFVLIGEAERSFLFFDVYDIAYYRSVSQSNKSNYAELLTLNYERDLPKEKVHNALSEGLEKNLSNHDFQALSQEITKLVSSINTDVKEGDSLKIFFKPEGKVSFYYNNVRVSSFSNTALSRALRAIWLGGQSVVDQAMLTKGLN